MKLLDHDIALAEWSQRWLSTANDTGVRTLYSNPHTGTNFVPVIFHNMACHFNGTKSVETARWRIYVCSFMRFRHVVPSVTHKLRTVHEMRDTQCHAYALNNFVVTSRDTLEINFSTFQKIRHNVARTTSPDPRRHASPRSLSRVLSSLARQISCHGVNPLSCQCEACFSDVCLQRRV